MQFKELTRDEIADYRQWARDNFKAGDEINPVWHPAVREECERINGSMQLCAVELETPEQLAAFIRNGLYSTPSSSGELWQYALSFTDPGERTVAMTVCGMALNLAATYIEHDWDA